MTGISFSCQRLETPALNALPAALPAQHITEPLTQKDDATPYGAGVQHEGNALAGEN